MSSKLLQLSLYVVTVIQLTSAQSACNVTRQDNSCENAEEMMSQLMTAVSESRKYDVNSRERSERMFSQLMTALSQLKLSDVNSSSRTDQVLNQLMTAVTK